MADLDIEVSIDGDDGLDFTEANGYLVIRVGPGSHAWDRQTVRAPFDDEVYETSRRRGPMSIDFAVLVGGETGTQLGTRLVAAITAVEQRTYLMTAVIDGVTWKWKCRGADTSVGEAGSLDARRLAEHQQVLTANIPRSPRPVLGPA